MKTETKQIEGYLEKVKRSPKYFGYYLKKDGSPIVVENSDDSVIAELKSNGYWNSVQFINDAEGIKKHLKTYNSGFSGKRVIIKPFYV
jgi:uncharacterized protein (DUF1330 family)